MTWRVSGIDTATGKARAPVPTNSRISDPETFDLRRASDLRTTALTVGVLGQESTEE